MSLETRAIEFAKTNAKICNLTDSESLLIETAYIEGAVQESCL